MRVPPQGPCGSTVVARYDRQAGLGHARQHRRAHDRGSRDQAREAIKRIKAGLSAFEPPPVQPDTVADVCAGWLKRHVEAKGLRTGDELRRVLERYVLPRWRDRPFAEIRRSDVAALLDAVEDEHGAWVADQVLAVLGSVASWYATPQRRLRPALRQGHAARPGAGRKRSRILTDAELRAVWQAAEAAWGLRCLRPAVVIDGAAPREGR